MSPIRRQLRHYRVALLGAAVLAGCSSGGTDNNNPGTIALGLNPTSGTAQAGNSAPAVTATLTRGGGFTGTVNLTVTGNPTGVTAAVTNVVTTGTTTTATVTVSTAANTTPGSYQITVHGIATTTGVTEATATYQLTVTAPPTPAVAVALTVSPLTIQQGASTPTTTVNLTRTNFTGDVTLSVVNLPTGVTASFTPANPQTTSSSVLTLAVAADAPTGTFTNLLVKASGTGITDATAPLTLTISAPASNFTLSLTSPTLSIAQGASIPTTTVNINRVNFTGDVALSVLNLPTGVTAAFAPANPQTTNSSVLTLTVAADAPTGTFTTLSVQGVGTSGTVATPLSLTITAGAPAGNFTLTTTPTPSASVTQGNHTDVTVNVNRTGGNASDVTLSLVGALTPGLTAQFTPTHTTGATATLTFTATGAAAVGAYPVVIHGNATGLGEQLSPTFTINVVAPSGTGNASLSFVGCDPEEKAVWVAFMDGTAGTWTPVTGVGDVYQFNITQSKGSFAYVTLGTGTSEIFVENLTQAELTAGVFTFCGGTVPPTGKTVNGTVNNFPTSINNIFGINISFAGSATVAFAGGPFQLLNAADGQAALVAYAHPLLGGGSTEDKVIILRGENPANGGNFSQPLDFGPLGPSQGPAIGNGSITGVTGSETQAFHSMTYYTGGAACTPASLYGLGGFASNFTFYGVPASLRAASGDMHSILIAANEGTTSFRLMQEYFLDVVTRALTPFALPAALPAPVVTDAGGPYKRPNLVVTGVPAEYNLSDAMTYTDQTSTGKSGTVAASHGWVGGSNVTLTLPNFAGVGAFQNAWAPATGDAVNWTFSTAGGTLSGSCTAGQRFVSASKAGNLP